MSEDVSLIVILGGGASLILFLFAFFWPSREEGLSKRLARVEGKKAAKENEEETRFARSRKDSAIPWLDRLVKSLLPNPDKMRLRLAQTGKEIPLGVYVLSNLIAVFVFYLIFRGAFGWSAASAVFLGIAAGLYVPHFVTGFMASRRQQKFLNLFPETLDTLCRGLRAGLPITESISSVSKEMPDPIGIEFRRVSDGVKMGRALDLALWDVSARIASPEFRFFIIALAIQRETGGNLAETLGNLAELLRKRRQLKKKVKAMSSEAKASAMIIGSLPFVMFGIMMVTSPEYVMVLFHDPRGKILLGIAGSLIGVGVMVMRAMIQFEL